MPSSLHRLPRFPEGLPLAPIAVVSYDKLLRGDGGEAARLLSAAKKHGFFYLDLRGAAAGEALLAEAEQLRGVAEEAFAAPADEKQRCALRRGVSLFGYKTAGTVKATDRDRRPDSTEFFNISKDDLHRRDRPHHHGHDESAAPYPPQIERHRPLLRSFTRHGHECGMVVLRALAEQLGLARDEFARLNLFDRPSGDHCRLTRMAAGAAVRGTADGRDPAAIGLPSHTDFGSVTVLFNWLGGLQIEAPAETGRTGQWDWVKPVPGHAIVNLGDAMVAFTNGELKSAKHRVVPLPGEQGALDRYSVVYFVRPHNDVLMKPLSEFDNGTVVNVAGKFSAGRQAGEVLTAGEWIVKRGVQMGN